MLSSVVPKSRLELQSLKMSSATTCSTTTGAAQQLFTSALNFFAASQCFLSSDPTSDFKVPNQTTFDFIVIGAGSAGSVVASRLSEISEWNILVLEAGLEPPYESDVPFMDTDLYGSTYDWFYETKYDITKAQTVRNGIVTWPRGKMLGGCSSMNGMLYVRGQNIDFQSWVDIGNPSWTVENVTNCYMKAESFQDVTLDTNPLISASYGHEGPLIVNTFNSTDRELTNDIVDSWGELGLTEVDDFNAATYYDNGFCGISRVTAQNGQRGNTYKDYLKPVRDRDNLKIVTNAFVTKILINNEKQAYGVEVDINGTQYTFLANYEVIVSGGAINTPQLLMLSGIGPAEHLSSKGISCVSNLTAVGQNLRDHPNIFVPIYGDKPGKEDPAKLFFGDIQYLYDKTGPLAQGSLTDAMAFFSQTNTSYPEIQVHHLIYKANSSLLRGRLGAFTDQVIDSYLSYNAERTLYIFALCLLHPQSSGSITLNSSDPYNHPLIDPNYFGDERDIDSAVKGINTILSITNTSFFQSMNASSERINITECNQYEFPSDLYWRCFVLQMTITTFHPIGTAKMGPSADDSVVNNFLKVYGVEKLRVIDASIMPIEPSGNTNAPTIMIGEMGANMIKADYNKS